MKEWFLQNWEAITASGPIAAVIAYLTTKKQRKVESLDGIAAAYDKFVADHNDRYDAIKQELETLKSEVSELNNVLKNNTKEIEVLKKENTLLHFEIDTWKKKYTALKSAFDMYKKRIAGESK
jgi:chromosome segregation ATPase